MRQSAQCLILAAVIAAAPALAAQEAPGKGPSKAKTVAKKLAVAALSTCNVPGTAGAVAVVAAKDVARTAIDSTAAAPCATSPIAGMPGGGMSGSASPLGAMAAATPIGMAVTVAPTAIKAGKSLGRMLGGKPQDKEVMLRGLGEGRLELKAVKFVAGSAEMQPGFEASLAELGAALAESEGAFLLHVPGEVETKDGTPDTVLAGQRIESVRAVLLAAGVPAERVVPTAVLPPGLAEGRKPVKLGKARVELIRPEAGQ